MGHPWNWEIEVNVNMIEGVKRIVFMTRGKKIVLFYVGEASQKR